MLKGTAAATLALAIEPRLAAAQATGGAAIEPDDRVFIANEDLRSRLEILRAGPDPEAGGFPAIGGTRGPIPER